MMDQNFGYYLKTISDKLKARAASDLKNQGLTFTQVQILGYLYEHEGLATQKELEIFLKVSHPTVVGVISRLERDDFVETWFDPQDKRIKMVRHTEKAVQARNKLVESIENNESVILNNLDENDLKDLERILKIISSNLE